MLIKIPSTLNQRSCSIQLSQPGEEFITNLTVTYRMYPCSDSTDDSKSSLNELMMIGFSKIYQSF